MCFHYPITIFVYILGTSTTISVNFTVFPGKICVTCNFLELAVNSSCYGVITSEDAKFQTVFTISASSDLHTKCVPGLSSAVYQLSVYDVDNNGTVFSLPALIYHNISILATGL